MVNIPICIMCRSCNEEIKQKSMMLLPYAYNYMAKQQFAKRCVIISPDQDILDYAIQLGFEHTFLEPCNHFGQCISEMNGVLHFLLSSTKKYDWFIVFNIDQPFKDPNLLYNVIRAINDNYDIIASASYMKDRSRLFISEDNRFITPVDNAQRMIDYCPTVKFVDSSVLAVKTSFFFNCCVDGEDSIISQADFYQNFWAGKFFAVTNDMMFIQILSTKSVGRFKTVNDIYQEVEAMKNETTEKEEGKD